MKTIFFLFFTLSLFAQTESRVDATTKSGASAPMECELPQPLTGPTKSGNYGHPVHWFKRYMHKIPGVNQLTRPNMPTVGSTIDKLTDRPVNESIDEPTVDIIYKEYLTLDSTKRDSIKNVLHKHWTQEMFDRSQAAVYRTYKHKSE